MAKELNLRHSELLLKIKKNYLKLQQEISLWQQEEGSAILDSFRPAGLPPHFTPDSLPEEKILALWQRLNEISGENVGERELRTLWKEFKEGKAIENKPLFSRFKLAFSGVAQLACKQLQLPIAEENQAIGPCPVCGNEEFISTLVPPVGRRYLHCLLCSYERPVMTSGCVHCGSEEASKQIYLQSEEFPGVEMVACLECGSYFKQLDLRGLTAEDLVWEDIRTLPLNYAAEQWLAEQENSGIGTRLSEKNMM